MAASDTLIQIDDITATFGYLVASKLLVTPSGGSQTTLGLALAATGGSPGGSTGQIQFNNNGIFGGKALSGSGNVVLDTGATLTTPVLSGGTGDSIVIGGVTPAAGTFTTLGFTGTLQQSGVNILVNTNTTGGGSGRQCLYVGALAGIVDTASLNTFVGFGAGQNSVTGSEATFIGCLAGAMSVGSAFSTAVGEHAIGYDVSPIASTAIGNDSQRNHVTPAANGNNTTLGKSSLHFGGAINNTALGCVAMGGNSGGVKLSGTPTANEVISVTFACSASALYAGAMTGVTHTVNYNVGGTPTLANIATGLSAAINADTTLAPLNNGAGYSQVADTVNVQMEGIGTSATGQMVTITASTTGTTVVTPSNGFSGADNVSIGYTSMRGVYLTSASFNFAVGKLTLYNLVTGGNNIAIGQSSGTLITTGNANTLLGQSSGSGITTGGNNVGVGTAVFSGIGITGQNHVAIGANAMSVCVPTATGANNGNVAIGNNALQGAGGSFFSNVAVGCRSGIAVSTGSLNTFVGSNTALVVTSGGSNTIIGANVGNVTLTTGAGNLYIGAGNNTAGVIDAATSAESNTFRLGNNATNLMRATGINTATPALFLDWLPASTTFANDAAAATGGVAVGQLYRNGSVVQCRIV